ncbi:hypothetical protein NC651_026719 [Populus alba x Populus x berolinensis]|nr:hypothetical protein NC651_026719 [Populus alba x Populus x berolinensis]
MSTSYTKTASFERALFIFFFFNQRPFPAVMGSNHSLTSGKEKEETADHRTTKKQGRQRRKSHEREKRKNWAKTERKRSRHRGKKTNTKGRKQRTKPSFGLVPDSSITQNKTEKENKEKASRKRRTTRENWHRHLLNSSILRTEKTEEHKEKAEKVVGTTTKESRRQGQMQTGGTTALQPSSSSPEAVPKILVVHLSKENFEPGSSSWLAACNDIRRALEEYSFFEVVYNEPSMDFYREIISVLEELFNLPDETKTRKYTS